METISDCAVRLFVGGHASRVQGEPQTLTGDRMFTAAHPPQVVRFATGEVGRIVGLLDSGAFSDRPERRLTAEGALCAPDGDGGHRVTAVERTDWDRYFIAGAAWAAGRATCPKRRVGALIVNDRRVVSTGYNGAPPGAPHCVDVGCLERDGHCVRAIHAEDNAILHTAVRADLAGATLYLYGGTPCYACARAIVAAGIVRVVASGRRYSDPDAVALLIACGVALVDGTGSEE